MRVKICGLRRETDAELAIGLGATHVGVVLAADSPRCATHVEARAIVRCARGRAEAVLVFRGESNDAILRACEAVGVLRVQVHGADVQRCRELAGAGLLPIPVAVVSPVAQQLPVFADPPTERNPSLLDGGCGGAGTCFAWSLLANDLPHAVFIAGGVSPTNVAELLRFRPWGIDVSSGIEIEPGIKDPVLMRQLLRDVRAHGVVA